jgi:two-component system, chemotaxis family, CheB/CheR fusion protein
VATNELVDRLFFDMRKKKPKRPTERNRSLEKPIGPAGSMGFSPGAKPGIPPGPFRVVGIGASAGGLEALQEFFSHIPPESGMAFVVVTHQHPGRTSLLPELLQKETPMPVEEGRPGQRVERNHVYLSRAESYLGVLGGALQLLEIKERDNARLPIDHFFGSLAEDQGERAVGIVLSGTGTDGTLGVKAIKGARGLAMAQNPESAQYPGMPLSAAATGLLDHVLPPKEIAERLLAYAKGPHWKPWQPEGLDNSRLPERLQKIVYLLRGRTGHDFSAYKTSTIGRRVERRMGIHQIKSMQEYLSFLQDSPHEVDLLFKELLIGVTSFFRDANAFKALAKKVLPELLKSRPAGSTFRVWVPGCSTGEEAYTLAMVLHGYAAQVDKQLTIQIFATDLDVQAIDAARTGSYRVSIAADVPRDQLSKYFAREAKNYRVKKIIRDLVVFAPHNLLTDPPFTKLDLLSCRNLLIYLNAETQARLFSVFHYALRPEGALMLGPSESIGDFSRNFAVADKKWRIFVRKPASPGIHPLRDFPITATSKEAYPVQIAPTVPAREPRATAVFEKLLADRFVPASVIINAQGDIAYIHGRTGDYLEPASGQPHHMNLLEMAREGLNLELAAAIHRASTSDEPVMEEAVRVRLNDVFTQVNVTVTRLAEPMSVRGLLLVTFHSAPASAGQRPAVARIKQPSKKQAGRVQELERELRFTRESLRSTVEELQSSNEELQSTNEELQSSNEELETSREEMQSLNEELQTVNAQLQTKVDALSETNSDMQNLLNSTSIATIFLDSHLRIKRFTEQAKAVINLIPSDVGRPVADLVSNLNYDKLGADAAEVLRTLNFKEQEVQTKQGGWRLVRILPYRTTENVIDGVVITFIDINRLKKAEEIARQSRLLAENIVTTLHEPILVLDTRLRVISANDSFYRCFRATRAEVEKRGLFDLGGGSWDVPVLRQSLDRVLARSAPFEDLKLMLELPRVGRRILLLNGRRLHREPDAAGIVVLAMEDITGKPPRRNARRQVK